jgi:hypothetical protein
MRKAMIAIAAMVAAIAVPALAAESESGDGWYIGINPIAAVAPYSGYASPVVQMLSAGEVGAAFSFGASTSSTGALEGRLSLGMPNGLEFLSLGSVAYKCFPFAASAPKAKGFFVGPELRVGDVYYFTTDQSYFNIVPSVETGWRFVFGKFYINCRLVQSVAALTLSTDPEVHPAVAWMFTPSSSFSPILPLLSVDFGIRLE